MSLGLRQFRYFVAVVDAGSFARASELHAVAASALSHHVSEIERDLGVRVLERRPRGIDVTAAGQRLYEHAKAILAAVGKAEADLRTFNEEPSGTIAIGITHTAVEMIVTPFLRRIKERFDKVQIRIIEGLSSKVTARVLDGDADMALVYNSFDDPRLEVVPLLEEQHYLVGRPDIVGTGDEPIDLSSILHKPVLAPLTAYSSRHRMMEQLVRSQVIPADWIEVDSLNALREIVEAGLGCTILSRSAVKKQLAAGTVHARRIVRPEITRSVKILSLVDRPKTQAFVQVRAELIDCVKMEVLSGRWEGQALDGLL